MSAHPDVIAHLDRLGLTYEVMDCDPALADTAQFCEAYGVPLEESANAILVASKKPEGHHAVCVVLAHTRLDVNGAVRRRLGVRKLSFAAADTTRELTGQEIGGVTIFGLPDDMPVWLDGRIARCDRVVVGAGSRSAKIRFDPSQLAEVDGYDFVHDQLVDGRALRFAFLAQVQHSFASQQGEPAPLADAMYVHDVVFSTGIADAGDHFIVGNGTRLPQAAEAKLELVQHRLQQAQVRVAQGTQRDAAVAHPDVARHVNLRALAHQAHVLDPHHVAVERHGDGAVVAHHVVVQGALDAVGGHELAQR